jgi:hypothetical protein
MHAPLTAIASWHHLHDGDASDRQGSLQPTGTFVTTAATNSPADHEAYYTRKTRGCHRHGRQMVTAGFGGFVGSLICVTLICAPAI